MKEKSIKNLFNSTITSALKQVDMVTAPKDKAMCLAEIAKAIALTGNVRNYTVPKDNIGDVIEVTDDPIKEVVEKAAKEVSEKKNSKNKEYNITSNNIKSYNKEEYICLDCNMNDSNLNNIEKMVNSKYQSIQNKNKSYFF